MLGNSETFGDAKTWLHNTIITLVQPGGGLGACSTPGKFLKIRLSEIEGGSE